MGILRLFSLTLRFHFLAYWNLCVIAKTTLLVTTSYYTFDRTFRRYGFAVLYYYIRCYFFCFPLNCVCCQLSITAVVFPKLCLFTKFCRFGGWPVLRLMRSFIKKEGMVYYEIIHSICITNFVPKIVIYGRYGYYIR